MTTHNLETKCPHCGKVNDAATGPDGEIPGPGDAVVCLHCFGPGEIQPDLRIAKMDMDALGDETRAEIQQVIDQLRGRLEPNGVAAAVLTLENARLAGYLQALRDYAWWKDGVQYVGSCGTTLSEAIGRAKRENEHGCKKADPEG